MTTPNSSEKLEEILIVTIGQLMIRSENYPNVGQIVKKIMPIINLAMEEVKQREVDITVMNLMKVGLFTQEEFKIALSNKAEGGITS